jgi:hypothetical protein
VLLASLSHVQLGDNGSGELTEWQLACPDFPLPTLSYQLPTGTSDLTTAPLASDSELVCQLGRVQGGPLPLPTCGRF